MIDAVAVRNKVDLSSEITTQLRKSSSSNGGEWSGECPFCGGTDRFSFQPHSQNGQRWLCRVCSDGKWQDSIEFIRRKFDLGFKGAVSYINGHPAPKTAPGRRNFRKTTKNKRPPRWHGATLAEYRLKFTKHSYPEWVNLQSKPVTQDHVDKHHLGYGQLPLSKCRHNRLVVPVFIDDKLVCIRGRRAECDCDGKWLASGGFRVKNLPLFNSHNINRGDVVVLVENPVDAILMRDHTGYCGVATLSVCYWQEHWIEPLRRASKVIIGYDNDLVGNGGADSRQSLIDEWRKDKPDRPLPKANGIRLANALLKEGLTVALFNWGNSHPKADFGDLITRGVPINV